KSLPRNHLPQRQLRNNNPKYENDRLFTAETIFDKIVQCPLLRNHHLPEIRRAKDPSQRSLGSFRTRTKAPARIKLKSKWDTVGFETVKVLQQVVQEHAIEQPAVDIDPARRRLKPAGKGRMIRQQSFHMLRMLG